MATLLLSFKRNSDSSILIHGFLTPYDKQSEKDMDAHARDCPKFGPAVRADETIEQSIEVDTIPDFDELAIEEWVDEMFGVDDEEEDDDEEEGEEESDPESTEP